MKIEPPLTSLLHLSTFIDSRVFHSSLKIVNAACKGSRCSRTEFYVALGLLHQVQQGEELNVHVAQQKLALGSLGAPTLNLSEFTSDSRTSHTFPPTAPSGLSRTEARPPGPMREMSDPWNASSGTSINGNDFRTTSNQYDGMPQHLDSTSTYDSAFRGGFAGNGLSGPSDRNRSTFNDNRRTHQLFTHNEGSSTDAQTDFGGNTYLSADQSRPTARQPKARQERPFSYMSETAETNAVDAAEDPSAELPEDDVTVRLRSELEGFIIKHNVYIVTSSLRKNAWSKDTHSAVCPCCHQSVSLCPLRVVISVQTTSSSRDEGADWNASFAC